jgi:NADPH:quinone reductase-like Zn-dependent oxidoreductase
MKAVLLTAYGDVDNLELSDVPEPTLGPKEVKVRVGAASINPVDCKLRRGELRAWMPLELPAILGRDAAGEVVEAGPGVNSLAVGDRVMGLVQRAYAEFVVGPAEAFAKMPPEMELDEAASLPLVGLTGVQLIEQAVGIKDGDVVLVTGAVGSVGRVAVFAAKQRGARVIAGVRASQTQLAEALDAESIVALDDAEQISHLPELDAIADTVDGQALEAVLGKLKTKGVLGTVLGEPPGARERGLTVRSLLTHPDSQRLAELGQSLAGGHLELPIRERFSLADVRLAHEAAEKPGTGKVVLLV